MTNKYLEKASGQRLNRLTQMSAESALRSRVQTPSHGISSRNRGYKRRPPQRRSSYGRRMTKYSSFVKQAKKDKQFKFTPATSDAPKVKPEMPEADLSMDKTLETKKKFKNSNKAFVKKAAAKGIAKDILSGAGKAAKGAGKGAASSARGFAAGAADVAGHGSGAKIKQYGRKQLGLKGEQLDNFIKAPDKSKLKFAKNTKPNTSVGDTTQGNVKDLQTLMDRRNATRLTAGAAGTAGGAYVGKKKYEQHQQKKKRKEARKALRRRYARRYYS